MAMKRSAGWIAGAVFLIVAIFAGTYFLMYVPRTESTDQTLAQARSAEDQNVILQREVADLAAKFKHLDDYKAKLAQLAVAMPPEAGLPDLTAAINAMAETAAVTITELTPGAPMTVTVPAPLVPAGTATPTPTPAAEPNGSAVDQAQDTADDASNAADQHDTAATPTPAPAAGGAAQIDGFVAIPMSVTIVGGYPNALSFVEQMQANSGRIFLATDVELTRQKRGEASGGKPATNDGDVEMRVTGYYYVLLDTTATAPPADDGATPAPVPPLPSSDQNPFAPLTPTK